MVRTSHGPKENVLVISEGDAGFHKDPPSKGFTTSIYYQTEGQSLEDTVELCLNNNIKNGNAETP